jgi:hypothetical protein
MKNAHLTPLHKIIQKNAYTISLFFFVDGAIQADSSMTPRKAIQLYVERYEMHELDIKSAVTQYNRMRSLYLRNNILFTH